MYKESIPKSMQPIDEIDSVISPIIGLPDEAQDECLRRLISTISTNRHERLSVLEREALQTKDSIIAFTQIVEYLVGAR